MSEVKETSDDRITTTTDAFGRTTTHVPASIALKQRELQALLRPDHNCTGGGSIGESRDGSVTSSHWPCGGCEAQRNRVKAQRPDLFPEPAKIREHESIERVAAEAEKRGGAEVTFYYDAAGWWSECLIEYKDGTSKWAGGGGTMLGALSAALES